MRLNLSKSWIFRGWITCALFTHLYAQSMVSSCDKSHYPTTSGCCKKCGPGFHVHADCTDSEQTRCIKCASDEYQPGWTKEKSCMKQKFCDTGKGFKENVENLVAEETCKCIAGLQCSAINCEFCERIPTCSAGHGLEPEPELTNGRQICLPCKRGFFSSGGAKPCKPWTNCKAEGRSETRPGAAHADAVCGPHVTGPSSSWVIVSVLSVITVLCLLILILFCYKDKLKLLSVNLRSCVQNLKRSRIQQETLAPLYSGAVGVIAGAPGGPKCMPCETTKLICQAPHSVGEDTPCTYPTPVPEVKVSMPESEETKRRMVVEGQSEGSGGPEEVSEDEDFTSAAPLVVASCVCGVPVRQPLEVGENEDCSQAVSSGTPGTCYCRGPDGEERGREEKHRSQRADRGGERGGGDPEKVALTMSEASVASLVSLSPLPHTSCAVPPPSPHPELCLPLTQAHARPDVKVHLTDRPEVKAEELYRLTSTDSESSSAGTASASAMSSVSPLMTSSSVGDLYLDKPSVGSGQEQGQGLSWADGRGNKLTSGDTELECPPESLQSQLAEPTLTSGQVSGNHNTTFISSGQVMNFSGDVIVVYVSQTSLGAEGAGPEHDFGSPVQEQASETAPFFPSSLRDSASHSTLQDETLPVQEAMEQPSRGK